MKREANPGKPAISSPLNERERQENFRVSSPDGLPKASDFQGLSAAKFPLK
jgi:hypothetical protein